MMKNNDQMNNHIGKRLFQGTITIIFVGILAKLSSFIAEAFSAALLGTTYQSDAYYMISGIQQVIYPMLSVGIWKVFLPLYKSHISRNEQEAAESLTNKALSFFTLISISVSVLLAVFAPFVVSIVAPGFEGNVKTLCIRLVRISSPMYVLIIASAIYASILQANNKFLGSQIREVASHIPTILAAVFFYKRYGVNAMAIALIAGGLFRLLVELPFVDWGYRFKPDFTFKTLEFISMLKSLPSSLISEGVTQINTLIDKSMASKLPEGTISSLNYGNKLMNVFSGLLSTAIATALYPQMIELIALNKKDDLSKLVSRIIRIFCIIMIPVTCACILFRRELVSVVYQRGSFNEESVRVTSAVFALYCIGIFFIACNTVITNMIYGYGDTKTPMFISIINLIINVILNVILIRIWGINGLALSTSISAIISFFIRIGISRKYIDLDNKALIVIFIKTFLCSIAACGAPRILFLVLDLNKYLVLALSAALGVLFYFVLIKQLKISEIDDLLKIVKSRMKKDPSI